MDSDYLTNGLQTNCYTNTNNAYNQYCSLVMFIVEKREVYYSIQQVNINIFVFL